MLACGVSPGSSRLPWLELPSDQLTCLPEPLTPAKGFSCSRQAMPYFSATRRSVIMIKLLVVGGHVGRLEDRGHFVLGRGHFVVPGLDRHAQLEQFALGLQHEGQHALGNRAEIVVFELLALGRLGAEQRAAGGEQVGPREVEVAIDQEVLLLRAGGRRDQGPVGVAEELQNPLGLRVQGLHRAQQRGLLVEGLAGPGDEGRGNAERRAVGVFQDVGRAGDVPGRVAAGLERGADAARRESSKRRARPGSVRLPENSATAPPSPSGARKLSCFSAVRPVRG